MDEQQRIAGIDASYHDLLRKPAEQHTLLEFHTLTHAAIQYPPRSSRSSARRPTSVGGHLTLPAAPATPVATMSYRVVSGADATGLAARAVHGAAATDGRR